VLSFCIGARHPAKQRATSAASLFSSAGANRRIGGYTDRHAACSSVLRFLSNIEQKKKEQGMVKRISAIAISTSFFG
jgi:hypothetical protein